MNLFDRVFQLHRLLAGRRTVVPFSQIEDSLECSRATARRVIEHLRDILGAPLIYDRDAGGYRYDGDVLYELPGLWFSADELAALLTLDALTAREPSGLVSASLAPFRNRLETLLTRQGIGLPAWRQRLKLIDAHTRAPGPQFATIAGALAAAVQLTICYAPRGNGAAASARTVSPQRLTCYRGNWYLDAWCHQRQALRSFAVERIQAATRLEHASQPIAEAQLDAELASGYGIFSGPAQHQAELLFTANAAEWVADELWHPQQHDHREPNGQLRRTLPYSRPEELVMELLRYGPEVQVCSPPTLRAAVVDKLKAALGQY